ncbi:FxLD family lanthipeptide [Micromonospora sp. C51]|uniref:FxLD family lanthipeptide n=1 Tax=Micromonospora sp. C51 TaxID=2824879 RepID=UPI001B378A0E|nr:FxLD family lanthipeptide [Micromonospora sp. C51]MBQ1047812.1 FxLD family lanthipeptide [Micromonospora sp. C51]
MDQLDLRSRTGDTDELDLDVNVVASAPVVPELMRATDDGCGSTCASACTSCK